MFNFESQQEHFCFLRVFFFFVFLKDILFLLNRFHCFVRSSKILFFYPVGISQWFLAMLLLPASGRVPQLSLIFIFVVFRFFIGSKFYQRAVAQQVDWCKSVYNMFSSWLCCSNSRGAALWTLKCCTPPLRWISTKIARALKTSRPYCDVAHL